MAPGPDLPQVRCRVCGYDLTHLDWPRADYRCPECGEVNIPGDHRVAPLDSKPWPGPFRTLVIVLWPGLLTGSAIGLHALVRVDWTALMGVFAGMLGGVICLTWPWAAAEILMHRRVPEQGRCRYMPWIPLGAIVGNIMLAIAIARLMYTVA